jgi:K+ transporter
MRRLAVAMQGDLDDVTYYVGHETVIRRVDQMGLPGWHEAFFAVMERNAVHVSDFFQPSDRSGGRDRPAGFDLRCRRILQ